MTLSRQDFRGLILALCNIGSGRRLLCHAPSDHVIINHVVLSTIIPNGGDGGSEIVVVDVGKPCTDERVAVGCLGGTNPKIGLKEISIGDEPFGIGDHAADAATCARHHKADVLAGHLRTVLEEERLHGGCHVAPPERRTDDNGIVIGKVHTHGVDGRIGRGRRGVVADGLYLRAADGIVVGGIVESFLRRLNAQDVGVT